jgi:ADP-ribosyl-[dinitrogen reductase] hydrolase
MLIELAIGDAYGAGFEYADEMSSYNDLLLVKTISSS